MPSQSTLPDHSLCRSDNLPTMCAGMSGVRARLSPPAEPGLLAGRAVRAGGAEDVPRPAAAPRVRAPRTPPVAPRRAPGGGGDATRPAQHDLPPLHGHGRLLLHTRKGRGWVAVIQALGC